MSVSVCWQLLKIFYINKSIKVWVVRNMCVSSLKSFCQQNWVPWKIIYIFHYFHLVKICESNLHTIRYDFQKSTKIPWSEIGDFYQCVLDTDSCLVIWFGLFMISCILLVLANKTGCDQNVSSHINLIIQNYFYVINIKKKFFKGTKMCNFNGT